MILKSLAFILLLISFLSCNKKIFYGSVDYNSSIFEKPRFNFTISYFKSYVEISILNHKKTVFNRFIYNPDADEVYYINDELKQALRDTIQSDTSQVVLSKNKCRSNFLSNKCQEWSFQTSRTMPYHI